MSSWFESKKLILYDDNFFRLHYEEVQRLYLLRRLQKFGMSPKIPSNVCSCVVDPSWLVQRLHRHRQECSEWWRLCPSSPGLPCPLCSASTSTGSTGELPLRTTHTPNMDCWLSSLQAGDTGVQAKVRRRRRRVKKDLRRASSLPLHSLRPIRLSKINFNSN